MNITLFDLDGTLRPGYLMKDCARCLADAGLFRHYKLRELNGFMDSYYRGEVSFRQGRGIVFSIYGEGLRGQRKDDVDEVSERFVRSQWDTLYMYTEELVDMVKDIGSTAIITGNISEVTGPMCDMLGIEDYECSVLNTNYGVYDGSAKNIISMGEEKVRVLNRLISGLNGSISFGFGNSSQDLPMLQSVEYVFLVGDQEAREEAMALGLRIPETRRVIDEVRSVFAEAL